MFLHMLQKDAQLVLFLPLKYRIFCFVAGIVYLISSCVLNFCDLSPVEQMTSNSLEGAL